MGVAISDKLPCLDARASKICGQETARGDLGGRLMSFDLATQIWAQEHIEQMLQEAKQARLLRSIKDPRKPKRRAPSVMVVFRSLLTLFTQSRVARPALRTRGPCDSVSVQ